MIYRMLSLEIANSILDICEQYNIDYDIWNAEAMLFADHEIELGMDEKNWNKLLEISPEILTNK